MYSKGSTDYKNIVVPENYGGNAFRKGVYTDITPTRSQGSNSSGGVYSSGRPRLYGSDQSTSRSTTPVGTQQRQPYGSSGVKEKTADQAPTPLQMQDELLEADGDVPDDTQIAPLPNIEEQKEHSRPTSVFSLLPSFDASDKFPFGHGLGSEELFIIGMMLLVYTGSDGDKVDSELLLLLCILLFLG